MSERSMYERMAWAIDDTPMWLAEEAEEDGETERAESLRYDVYRRVDAVLAELREPDEAVLDRGGKAMLAQDVGPEVESADEDTLRAYRNDFAWIWRAAVDAIRPGAERDAPSERRGGPSGDEAVGEKGERPEDAIGR